MKIRRGDSEDNRTEQKRLSRTHSLQQLNSSVQYHIEMIFLPTYIFRMYGECPHLKDDVNIYWGHTRSIGMHRYVRHRFVDHSRSPLSSSDVHFSRRKRKKKQSTYSLDRHLNPLPRADESWGDACFFFRFSGFFLVIQTQWWHIVW